jgi:hypothetical protein
MCDRGRGIAQAARHPDIVARFGPVAAQRAPRLDFAHDLDAKVERSMRGIASDEVDVVPIGEREETARKSFEPFRFRRRKCQRQHRPPRIAPIAARSEMFTASALCRALPHRRHGKKCTLRPACRLQRPVRNRPYTQIAASSPTASTVCRAAG